MTNKIQKTREIIEKRYEYWREKELNSHSIESEIRMSECQHLLLMLNSLQEEPISKDLEEAAKRYSTEGDEISGLYIIDEEVEAFKAGTQWQKENLWRLADGDDLPEIDREIVALLDNGKVVFAHRPDPKGWDGKSFTSGKVEHYTPKTYDKGGWNQPNVKWWIDVELPKEIES